MPVSARTRWPVPSRHLGSKHWTRCRSRLRALPQDQVPLRAFDTVGLPALRALLAAEVGPASTRQRPSAARAPSSSFMAWTPWPTNWPPPATG